MAPLKFAGLGTAFAAGAAENVRFKSKVSAFQLQMPQIFFRVLRVFKMPLCFRKEVFFFPHQLQLANFSFPRQIEGFFFQLNQVYPMPLKKTRCVDRAWTVTLGSS
jgi:hypothetical protein